MSLRSQLGQLSWVAKRYPPSRIRRQWNVARNISSTKLPRATGTREVWGLSVVRDEADVLGDVLDHLLEQGLDHILVADNGSIDGTRQLLQRRAEADPRISVVDDATKAHYQSEKMTVLARRAWRAGAAWIVPFDADEFWFAPDAGLADWLRGQPDEVSIVHADFHHMVPTEAAPRPLRDAAFVVDSAPSFPGKVAVRTHPLLEIWPGNHQASRVGAQARGLSIAHAQYRSPKQVARKVRQGASAAQLTGHDLTWFSPHWVSGAALDDEAVDEVFARISRGEPDERIGYAAQGPMVTVRPLRWSHWDPDGLIQKPRRRDAR